MLLLFLRDTDVGILNTVGVYIDEMFYNKFCTPVFSFLTFPPSLEINIFDVPFLFQFYLLSPVILGNFSALQILLNVSCNIIESFDALAASI